MSSRRGLFVVRLLVTAVFLLPLLWMAAAALIAPGSPLPQTLQLLPGDRTVANFGRVWRLVPFGRFLLNSLLVAATAVPLTLLTSSWAGFSMAQLPRSRQRQLVVLSLAVLMVPGIALWSTRFLLYRWLGLLDSFWVLIVPAFMGTSPFYVLMFYRAFRRIPVAIFEAARLEGATVWQAWREIGWPLARPTAVGVGVLSFVLYWGDFVTPLLYLSDQKRYTLPLALQLLQQMSRSDWPLLMAAAVMTTAVPVLLFLLIQPYLARVNE